jgi:acyl-CoA thioester hydrolase
MNERPALIETFRGRVAAAECDHLGHMNVQFYVARISDATTTLSDAIGITASYIRTQRRALVTVHLDISYLAELKAGDLIAMHSGVLSVEPKKVRVIHRMTRVEDGKPAMSAKALMLGMDLEQRRSTPLDDAVLARARNLIVEE